jgi:hypothetical protein
MISAATLNSRAKYRLNTGDRLSCFSIGVAGKNQSKYPAGCFRQALRLFLRGII